MVLNLEGEYTVKSKQALLFESFFSVIILLLTFIIPIFSTYILIIFGWLTFTDLAKKKKPWIKSLQEIIPVPFTHLLKGLV